MSGTGYCADHDPLLCAGLVTCELCGHVAYPTDAAWLDGRLVMASFPAPCAHVRPISGVVDTTQLGRSDLWCHALTRTTGDPCRNRARPGGRPCRIHGER